MNHTSLYVLPFIAFVRSLLNNDYDSSKLLLPWVVPFDSDNLSSLQWFILWCIEFGYGIAYSYGTFMVMAFFIGGCYYLVSLCDQFKFLTKLIETDFELSQNEKNPKKYQAILRKIEANQYKSIDIHSKVFE